MKYVIALIFSLSTLYASEKDSVVSFNKKEITILANKIQLLRDSIQYLHTVVAVQDTLIDIYVNRVELYNEQLLNRESVIDACRKQNEQLEKINTELENINKELQPKWYDNNFLWFLAGMGTVVGIIIGVQ
jgi:chromosome segregation ATPase